MTEDEIKGEKSYYLEKQWEVMERGEGKHTNSQSNFFKTQKTVGSSRRRKKVQIDRELKYYTDKEFKLKMRLDPSILSTFFLDKF